MSDRLGWHATRLDELCDINPPRPKLGDVDDATEVLFVPMAAVNEVSGTVANPQQSSVGVVGRKSYRSFTSGDVLFAKITPCMENGKAAIVPTIPTGLGFGSTEFHVLRPKQGIDPRLIWHLVRQQSFRDEAANHFTGTVGQLRVPADFLKSFEVTVPPSYDHQSQLAALLDAATRHGSSASSHLATARRTIAQFRQAVVAAACSGRLTADWRDLHPGITAEQELQQNESRTQKVRRGVDPTHPVKSFEGLLPSTWAAYTVAQLLTHGVLEDVKDGNHGSNHPKVSEFTTEGLPFITANLVRNARIDYDAAPRVTGSTLGRLRVGFSYPGDVILTHKGTVGRVAVATREAVLTPQTTYYRSSEAIDPNYLALFIGSFLFYEQLANVMSQTTRDFVPITQQYKLTVILPPRAEQLEIVDRTNKLLAAAEALTVRIDAASNSVDRVSQAVPAKAFRGGLSA